MSIGQKLEKIATQEDLFPELSAEEKEANKIVAKIVTNADRIRAMTDEELAEFIAKAQFGILRSVGMALKYPGDLVRDCDLEDASDDWLDWLKQEVES